MTKDECNHAGKHTFHLTLIELLTKSLNLTATY